MLMRKVDNNHIEGHNESHIETGQKKFRTLQKKKQQEHSGPGPIEIKIYEDQMDDHGRMMLKISFAGQEIRQFTKR